MITELLSAFIASIITFIGMNKMHKLEMIKIDQETSRLEREAKQSDEQMVGASSSYIYERRVELCIEISKVAFSAHKQFYEVWDLTDNSEINSIQQKRLKEIAKNESLLHELNSLMSKCHLLGSENLIKAFSDIVSTYSCMMHDTSHYNGMVGMDGWSPLIYALRNEIGADPLSAHFFNSLAKTQKVLPSKTDNPTSTT